MRCPALVSWLANTAAEQVSTFMAASEARESIPGESIMVRRRFQLRLDWTEKATSDMLLKRKKIYLLFPGNTNDPLLLFLFLLQAWNFYDCADWKAMENCDVSALGRHLSKTTASFILKWVIPERRIQR